MTEAGLKISKAINDFKKLILGDMVLSKESIQEPLRPEVSLESIKLQPLEESYYPKVNSKVFVVGPDNEVVSAVRVLLEKMGIEVLVASASPNSRESISVQFQIHDNQFDFAIVVLSADELSLQKKQDLQDALLVSAQKTVFELGFLVGKLGRHRVAVIYQDIERFKRPTEYFDLSYILFNPLNLWQNQLMRQMKACGLNLREESASKLEK